MKVSIVGTGYVGLVSGACLADKGHDVICIDVDSDKVDKINAAVCPIYESGLEEILKRNVGSRLSASTDLYEAVLQSAMTLIAVGTPFDGSSIDVSFIEEASRQIGRALKDKEGFHVVVVKSTVVPGTTDSVVIPILERESGKVVGTDFGVGMNPEFLREGEAISDFMIPDRIVYGASDSRSIAVLDDLYAVFEGVDIVRTTNKTAEMIKYTANSLLATLISFSNEIANLCTALGEIDVVDVMKGVHLDRRLSPILDSGERIVPTVTTFIEAGCGFGGSCFPKDVKALIAHGNAVGEEMSLLRSVVDINKAQPMRVLGLLKESCGSLDGLRVAVLGLAFKPGTDDMRESPAIPIINSLHEEGALITAYDPIAIEEARKVFKGIPVDFADSMKSAVEEADAVVLVTIWDEFSSLPDLLNGMNGNPVLVDGRRMIGKDAVPRYRGIGLTQAEDAA